MEKKLPKKLKIMSGILLSASPVTSYRTFKQRGPLQLRDITKQQYIDAAVELEKSNLGTAVISETGGVSFLKRSPSEVQKNLQENFPDLCAYSSYVKRFILPIPSTVSLTPALQEKITELKIFGLVFTKQTQYYTRSLGFKESS